MRQARSGGDLPEILLVTETADLSADLLVLRLRERGIPFVRFNQDRFPDGIEIAWDLDRDAGEIGLPGRRIKFADIAAAWFRPTADPAGAAPTPAGSFVERESAGFLASLWEAAPWRWVNRPSAVRRAARKPLQLIAARRAGLAVPSTLITNSAGHAREFVGSGPAIAKAVVGGRVSEGDADYALYTTSVTPADLEPESAVTSSPTTYQRRIAGGCDLRVTIVGSRLFAVRILIDGRRSHEVDWRAVEPQRLSYQRCELPDAVAAGCLELMRELSLGFAAIDFILAPDGRHVFLEVNPSGQWGWIERRVDVPITDAIVDLLAGPTECA